MGGTEDGAARRHLAAERGQGMRLAYFTNLYGSASFTFIMTEVQHLRRRGHSVFTFSARHPGAKEAVSEEVATEQRNTDYLLGPGLPLVEIAPILLSVLKTVAAHPRRALAALRLAVRTTAPGWKAGVKQLAYLVLACHLAERMKARRVEHLHNHLGSSSATIAMLASTLAGIPFSLTIHGGQIFYEPRRWALGEKIVRSAFTACVSSFCRSQCMVFVPHPMWPRMEIVRCVVDERFFAGREAPLPQAPHLVSVGRLAEEKGHLLLLEAAQKMTAAGVEMRLVLVGDGPLRSTLEERIAELGLQAVVGITGMVGADEVRRQLQAARAFVLASFVEGLPVAVMEAFAQGRPVVATNVGAVAELVRPGETGWLVAPGSVDALVEALTEVLGTNTERLAEMGRRGAALVAERHSGSTEIAKLESLFRQAIQPGKHPSP